MKFKHFFSFIDSFNIYSLKLIIILFFLSLNTACTTYRKTLIYSSSAGCLGAGTAGVALAEPKTKNNIILNVGLWCLVGGIITGTIGHLLYKDDPRNQPLHQMLFEAPSPIPIPIPTPLPSSSSPSTFLSPARSILPEGKSTGVKITAHVGDKNE